ncbi:MAG: YceI family protein [bacterium]|nr:YceI family protein [bacterium]
MTQQQSSGRSPLRVIVIGIVVVALIGVAAVAALLIAGGSGEASQAITAPTLAASTAGETTVFSIVPEESEVRFSLGEDLRGERVTVVGTTDQVAGQLEVDFATPANSEIGVIRINVRTLRTDNEFRDRAIRGFVLQSAEDRFEFAQFMPNTLTGMPESVTLGEPFTFQITGDLQLREIMQPVTFDVTVTPISETRIEGTASATVTRAQYELTIPNAPGVANVSEEVLLEIDFVAVAGAAETTPEAS